MTFSKQIVSYGAIKTAVKQGDKEHVKNAEEIEKKNQIKNICLNCTESECTARRCKNFKRKKGNNHD